MSKVKHILSKQVWDVDQIMGVVPQVDHMELKVEKVCILLKFSSRLKTGG